MPESSNLAVGPSEGASVKFALMMAMAEESLAGLAARAGVELVILDAEHGFPTGFDARSFVNAARTEGGRCVLRIAKTQLAEIGPVLDRGMDGLVISGVTGFGDMERVAEAVWYPPRGRRSVNPFVGAAAIPGDEGGLRAAAEGLELWAMGETVELLALARSGNRSKEAMLGWTGILVGPYDLAASLGLSGGPRDPALVSAVADLVSFARANELQSGIFCRDIAAMQAWWDAGIRTDMVVLGYDRDIWFAEVNERVQRGGEVAKAGSAGIQVEGGGA